MNMGESEVDIDDKQRKKKLGLSTRNNVTLYNYGLKPMGLSHPDDPPNL